MSLSFFSLLNRYNVVVFGGVDGYSRKVINKFLFFIVKVPTAGNISFTVQNVCAESVTVTFRNAAFLCCFSVLI